MSGLIKVKSSQKNVKVADQEAEKYISGVIKRLKARPNLYKYVCHAIPEGEDKAEVLKSSITMIDEFLEYWEKYDADEVQELTGVEGEVPLLKFDEYTHQLEKQVALSDAEKDRRNALKHIIACDFNDKVGVIQRGNQIYKSLKKLPRLGNPLPFLKTCKKVFLTLNTFIKGDDTKGKLFVQAGENGKNILDFIAALSAFSNKTVALISASRTFSDLATFNTNRDYQQNAASNLADARNADVLCIYGLDYLPTYKNFLESCFIPFLGTRTEKGKITFASLNNENFSDFVAELSPSMPTRRALSVSVSNIMDEFVLDEDKDFFKKN